MAAIFPYQMAPEITGYTSEPAVYKLQFGRKYYIWKGKSFKSSVEQNLSDISGLLYKLEKKVDHIFYPIVEHIKHYRVMECTVHLIMQTGVAANLVKAEADILEVAIGDPECLNVHFKPHIPKWLAEELSGVNHEPNKAVEAQRPVKTVDKDKRYVNLPDSKKQSIIGPQNASIRSGNLPAGAEKVSKLLDAFSRLHAKK